jgi:hypothetical protein
VLLVTDHSPPRGSARHLELIDAPPPMRNTTFEGAEVRTKSYWTRRLGFMRPARVQPTRSRRQTAASSYIYTYEFDRAIDLLATQQITVADLTTVISPLSDALSAFDALRAGQIMKALVAPGTRP